MSSDSEQLTNKLTQLNGKTKTKNHDKEKEILDVVLCDGVYRHRNRIIFYRMLLG